MESGQMLSHYRLVEKLGEGGMGVVWRALDTTLDREVAIKILPDSFEQHPDRLERFEREAKVLASLHHPNIAVLHGLHQHQGTRFLVMELVDGEDLSKRLARGPLPTMDAMKLCAQVARALQIAHDRNVVHRDLKPANVVLTASGEAKVLDFGLAKVMDPDGSADTEETSAPTVTTGGTMAGTILGTAAYMSPEQARGKPTDRRTDIWSFGCVLYESLTGVSEFRGDTMSDSIGAILHKSPDWDALPQDLPVTVHWLLRRCLTKDRDNRLHDIADARIELEQAIVDPEVGGLMAPAAEPSESGPRRGWLWPVAAAVLAVVAGLAAWTLKPAPASGDELVSLSLQLPMPQEFVGFTIAPDGRTIVYRAVDERVDENEPPESRLWSRRLDSFVPTPIPGTEGASFQVFSPDGQAVAYVVDRESGGMHQADLRVVGLDGRPPLTLANNATDHSGPQWLSANELVYVDYTNEKRLLAISRGGGDPRTYAEFPKTSSFSSFYFEVVGDRGWIMNNAFVEGRPVVSMIDPVDGTEVELIRDASRARMLDDGRLLFVRADALLVTRVDLDAASPTLIGDVKTVMGSGTNPTDRIQRMDVSASGHLAFVTGDGPNENKRLMTVDRDGNVETLVEAKGSYAVPGSFSPDGKLLSVVASNDETPAELWVVELDTGAKRQMAAGERVTFHGFWTPDERLVFTSWQGVSQGQIMIRPMRRNAEPVPLFDDWPEGLALQDPAVAFDGTHILFDVLEGDRTDQDIWIAPLDGSSQPRPLVATPASEWYPQLSPDGRWLAYLSNESGRQEVVLREHDATGEKSGAIVQVSRSGGATPRWNATGDELFFFDRTNDRMMGVRVESRDPLRLAEPRTLIADIAELRASRLFGEPELVPMPDGKRFVFVQQPDAETKVERIEVVLNWARLLER